MRIILNKSDQVDQQQLMRVYGALMWSLGKVFKSPEVCKVSCLVYKYTRFQEQVRVQLALSPEHIYSLLNLHADDSIQGCECIKPLALIHSTSSYSKP